MFKRGLWMIGVMGVLGHLSPLYGSEKISQIEEDAFSPAKIDGLMIKSHQMEIDLINPLLEPIKGFTYPKRVKFSFAPDVEDFKKAMHGLKDLLNDSETIDDFIIPLFYRETCGGFYRRFDTVERALFDVLPDGAYWETLHRSKRILKDMWIHAIPTQGDTDSSMTFNKILKEFEENQCPYFVENEQNTKNFDTDLSLLKGFYNKHQKHLKDFAFTIPGIYLYGRAIPDREFVGVAPKEFWVYWDFKTDTLTHIP